MKRNILVSLAVAFAAMPFAFGQVTPIGPFTGQHQEGFENQPSGQFLPLLSVLDNTATMKGTNGNATMHVTGSWGFFGTVFPHSGTRFFGSAGDPVRFDFTPPVEKFGGYFTTNSGVDDATAIFYDAAGNTLATLNVSAPASNQWVWNGWQSTVPLARIDVIGKNPYGGGFIDMDDLESTESLAGSRPIPPTSFTVVRGALVSGGLAELLVSDDQYLVVRNGPVAFPSEAPITITFEGAASVNTASQLDFVIENRVSINGLTQQVDMYDFAASAYDQLDSRPAPTTDLVVTIAGTNPSRYISSGNAVRSRLRIRPAGPLFTNNWRTYVDQVLWNHTP